MNARLTAWTDLTAHQRAAWHAWQRLDPALASPFLTPEFAETVAGVRGDVELAVLRDGDERDIGFFAFQRHGRRQGRPVAAGLSEWQGVVSAPDAVWGSRDLLRGCGLGSWTFDHVPRTQLPFSRRAHRIGAAPFADLRAGFAAYRQQRLRAARSFAQIERKARRLAREIGPLHFELRAGIDLALECLYRWKGEQHRRTGVVDIFQFEWVRQLFAALAAQRHDALAGSASLLFAGARPVAVHLGLRSRQVGHIWFPSYDRALAPHSPGLVLFLRLFDAWAAEGVERVDFGPGGQRYKQELKSGDLEVCLGQVHRHSAHQWLCDTWQRVRCRLAAQNRLHLLRLPASILFRLRQRRLWATSLR